MWFLGPDIGFDQGFWVIGRFYTVQAARIPLYLLSGNPKPIIMGLCYFGVMKTNNCATEPWDPNADFSVAGGGLHPWLAALDINTVIDMSDAEAEEARKSYENNR